MLKTEMRSFFEEGNRYRKTAVNGHAKRPKIFTPDILYNLLSMTIEKHFMAILTNYNDLADNHTFTDMINSAKRVIDLDANIISDLKEYERCQNLCPVTEGYTRDPIPGDLLGRMFSTAEKIEHLAIKHCV